MDILIITTYYPPDTAVAAVRPYMLAKYLTQRGHKVTVLRSGEFYNSASDFFDMDIPVRVISYLGPDSPAERYARGEQKVFFVVEAKRRIGFLPEWIRKPVSAVYNTCMRPVRFKRMQENVARKVEMQKKALDTMRDEHFDVVFSTYGQQENIEAGQYASKLFGCKLVQDFRDALASQMLYNKREYRYLKRIQDDAIAHADGVTAVSEGLRQELIGGMEKPCENITLYNGFEPIGRTETEDNCEKDLFTFCYTGVLHGASRDFTPLLRALRTLADGGRIDPEKIRLHYAGRDFDILLAIAQKTGLESILVNHGYVGRAEAAALQNMSDIFLVLSWNRKDSQGILTGKFYEGIRAKKPILSLISGDLPNSELNILNEQYRYGFCYEASREAEQFDSLCDYLANSYTEKMKCGKVQHEVNPQLEARFRYDNIAQQLEAFIQSI